MEFTIKKEALLKALQVTRLIQGTVFLPVLAGVLLKVQDDVLTATCTDIETTFISHMLLENVVSEGIIVLPAKKLYEIIKHLPDREITIRKNPAANGVLIKYGSEIFLQGYPPEEFPDVQKEVKSTAWFKIPEEKLAEFKNALKSAFIVSLSEKTPGIFSGVLFEVCDNPFGTAKLILSATDKIRFFRTAEIEVEAEGEARVVVPKTALKEVVGLEGEIHVTVGEGNISFAVESAKIISRLVTGQFPDLTRLVPDKFATVVTLDRKRMVMSLERARTVAVEEEIPVVQMVTSENRLNILSAGRGSFAEPLEADIQGEPLDERFNLQYLLDYLTTRDAETVTFGFNGPGPFRITDGKGMYIMIPLRKKETTEAA